VVQNDVIKMLLMKRRWAIKTVVNYKKIYE
jgi:hypothetical protein